jgi:hypothetical protein
METRSVRNGKRRAKEVTFGSLFAEAATEREARAKVLELAEAACTGSYTPVIVQAGGLVGLGWREPLGWAYSIVRDGASKIGCSSYGDKTREEVERRIRSHMAQNLLRLDSDPAHTGEEVIRDARDLESHRGYVRWQYSFRRLSASGLTFDQAHQQADSHEPAPWEEPAAAAAGPAVAVEVPA